AKVADFGIAKAMPGHAASFDPSGPQHDLTATGIVLGTAAYLAPEQIDGQPATAQSDLYSLGVVLYEALAGKKPFPGEDPIAIAHAARQGKSTDIARVRTDLDPGLADVIRRAMAVDPANRYRSAAAMAAALRTTRAAGGGGQPLLVSPPPEPDATAIIEGGTSDRLPPRPPPGRPPSYYPSPEDPAGGHPWAVPPPAGYSPPRSTLAPRGFVRRGPGGSHWPALLIVLLGAIVFVTVLALLLGGGNGSPSSNTAGSTGTTVGTSSPTSAATSTTSSTSTTTSTTVPSDPVGNSLRNYANTLQQQGGGGQVLLADLLTSVAQDPASGPARAEQASNVLAEAQQLYLDGQITDAEYSLASTFLKQAGGSLAPTAPGNGNGNGRGKSGQ
ncbi:MAG: serine/threonine-protein kinase, partial [Acidimicrobiales bacterium]